MIASKYFAVEPMLAGKTSATVLMFRYDFVSGVGNSDSLDTLNICMEKTAFQPTQYHGKALLHVLHVYHPCHSVLVLLLLCSESLKHAYTFFFLICCGKFKDH